MTRNRASAKSAGTRIAVSESIPPAYTHYLGEQLLEALAAAA